MKTIKSSSKESSVVDASLSVRVTPDSPGQTLSLSQLFESTNTAIFGIDAEGKVNEWNQTAARITGYPKEEVMGRDLVKNYITEEYRQPVGDVLRDALGGKETANYEFPLYTKSGDRVEVLLNATTRRDADGGITGVVGVGQDITAHNKAQIELIQASKLATLGEMATGVAHELNQPLNVILMASENAIEFLNSENIETPYLRSKLKRIGDQTQRAASIIDHMRVFGRKSTEEYASLKITDVIDQALEFMSQQMRLSAIKLVRMYPKQCPDVMGHKVQIEQVIINLLTNARDALTVDKQKSNRQRQIKISVYEDVESESVIVSVADNGGGIEASVINRIFEPFYTTKDVGKGTGLGLSVSYGIITEMGGRMGAENDADGAVLKIALPIAR